MGKSKATPRSVYGWPDVMRTSVAADYIGGSRWMILRAVASGALVPAGKVGRSFTFMKADLDRFMTGTTAGTTGNETAAAFRLPDASRPSAAGQAVNTEALERLRRVSGVRR